MEGTSYGVRDNLLLAIRALLPALNEQEQKVGQYILDSPKEVLYLAISDLAQRCAVSDATVFRFCKRVGTDGYGDLKIRLAQVLAASRTVTYRAVEAHDSLAEAAHKVITADIKALEDTLSVLDLAALARGADALLAARRVDIYGSGGGAVAALELQHKLQRVGVRAAVYADSESQVVSATLLAAEDVAVGISHSGASDEVLRALSVAKLSGARTIAITNHPRSPIAALADIQLSTAAQEALAHGYALGARVAQIALIDVLGAVLVQKRPEESERSLSRIAEVLHRRRS
ncbi:MAG: putative HTH-type transcriptional regulator YbbH [Chloroflexi bacterium ADurb.Bin325]|nr:MAG: putative HTH-type transcriptional regulator YbbH [Chloroflexi bacterium ADurb.Bin325]